MSFQPDSRSPPRRDPYPKAPDEEMVALLVLGWIVADSRRAERLLALTGLDAESLRAAVGDRGALAAVIGFVADHEPDLIACAGAIGEAPETIVAARGRLAP
jgi:hypothetical protein